MTPSPLPLRIAAAITLAASAPFCHTHASDALPAPVYNVRLATDSTPDLTDVPSYLRSITTQHATPQEKAIAIWRWSQRMRKQTSNPRHLEQDVLDPIAVFNSFGHCNCGIVSGLNNTFWVNMGWKARYVQLGDHTVCETSWDGGKSWHMFDASMSFYCFNDEGQVASVTEIEKNPRFYLQNFAPEVGTNPVKDINDHNGWRQASDFPVQYKRSLANGWDSFKAPNSLSEYDLHTQWGHRFVLNLRPGEHYTRYFGKLDEKTPAERLHRPLKTGKDPESQHGHQGIRANGIWEYALDLRAPGAEQQVYSAEGIAWGDPRKGYAVRSTEDGKPGALVLKVTAANVVTSAKLLLTASRERATDMLAVEVSTTAGITYEPVWKADQEGVAMPAEIDLMPFVAGATEYLVKVRLSGTGAGVEAARIETLTQINRAALPKLVRGSNRVQLTLGKQVETIQFQPSLLEGNHSKTAAGEKAIDVEKELGYSKPPLRPAENGVPTHVTWKIETPTPITSVDYGGTVCVKSAKDRTTLLHSWDGERYAKDFEKTTDDAPFDLMINRALTEVPDGTRAAYFRYEFQTERNAKSYSGPGIQMARMAVEHAPRVQGFTPIEATWCWVEHRESGDVERRYTALVESPAQEFTINVSGFKDPTMKWVRLNLKGSAPAGEKVAYGYSDGQDVGPGAAPERALYRWGTNVAKGRPYKLEGAQHEKNPDAGSDLTDGIIAPPDEYVSEKWMPTNVILEKESTAVTTLDLGQPQEIAAVRVHSGQEPGLQLAHPQRIVVEASEDGTNFKKVGETHHHQVFAPSADFQPWEHDESPKFAGLPAGGRLAYAYRVIFDAPVQARYLRVRCEAQPGWGLLLSEIEAIDRVAVDTAPPPAVYLPPLPKLTDAH
ncbi:MAG: hypothetical protein ACO1QR_12645 [Chthoniobacteraceae bacterium]